jgi:hypothetical protein
MVKGKVSAWFLFLKDEREALKKANTGTGKIMNRKKFMTEVGAKWTGMKDKSKYVAKANKDAERYEKEIANVKA